MAISAAGISHRDAIPRMNKPRHMFRKLLLVFLLTAAYALGLVLLFLRETWFPQVLFVIFADCTVAVVAGFGVRLLLSQRGWFIRTLVAGVMPVAGLAILGYFSEWEIGIDVIALSLGYVSWADLAHLVGAVTVSWVALWAWRRPARGEAASIQEAQAVRSTADVQPRRLRSPHGGGLQPGLRVSPAPNTGLRSRNGRRSSARARSKLVLKQPVKQKPKRRLQLRRPHVQLALVEEHRCPFCLEPVLRTDERGTKECEVCHTLHHADCWEITGTCQVPHLNT
jgi:hypothetical protein